MSPVPLVSPAARLLARDANTTYRPSALSRGMKLPSLASSPPAPTLTRTVVFAPRSRTKTSCVPLVSPATKLLANELNTTDRPSAEIPIGRRLSPLPCAPPLDTLTRVVVPVCRSWRNVSATPLVSPATSVLATDWNATSRPSALRAGRRLAPLPPVPVRFKLSSSVWIVTGTGFTVVLAEALLLPDAGSGSPPAMLAVFVIVPVTVGVTTIVIVTDAAFARPPMLHVTVPLAWLHVPVDAPVHAALPNVTPAGSVSVTTTPVALLGPLFVAVTAYARELPTKTGSGEAAFVTDRSML